MQLEIPKKYSLDFLIYLKKFFGEFIIGKLDLKKLRSIENRIYELNVDTIKINYRIDLLNLLMDIPNQLIIVETENINIIRFDYNLNVDRLPIKIINIYKIINYGTTHIQAYPIFSKAKYYIENHLQAIYDVYKTFQGGAM